MKKISLTIQTAVAMAFLLIFLLAAYTSIFGQENQDGTKKERTKVITMKMVEDENGTTTTMDTTFVFEGGTWTDENSMQFEFEKQLMKADSILKNIQVWVDDENNVFTIKSCDSLLFNLKMEEDFLKGEEGKFYFIQKEMEKDMKEMENEMKSFSYTFSDDVDGKGDSIRKIVIIHSDDKDGTMDSIIEKHVNYRTGKGNFMVVGDDNKMEIIEDKDGKTIIVKNLPGGTSTLEYSKDTIIEKGDCKIIVKTKASDDGTIEKNVEVFTIVDGKSISGDDSTNVIITMDGDNYTVKTVDKGQKIVMITSCKSFENLNETEKETLKSAGVKTKNNDLEIEDLKFAPNPNNGKFTLSFNLKEKKKVTINIYDMKGNLVYTETMKDFEGFYSKEIDISDQGTGTFFLQIVQGLYDIIKKIIIQ